MKQRGMTFREWLISSGVSSNNFQKLFEPYNGKWGCEAYDFLEMGWDAAMQQKERGNAMDSLKCGICGKRTALVCTECAPYINKRTTD